MRRTHSARNARINKGKLTALTSATEGIDEKPVEVLSQAVDLEGQLLDVCIAFLSFR